MDEQMRLRGKEKYSKYKKSYYICRRTMNVSPETLKKMKGMREIIEDI